MRQETAGRGQDLLDCGVEARGDLAVHSSWKMEKDELDLSTYLKRYTAIGGKRLMTIYDFKR